MAKGFPGYSEELVLNAMTEADVRKLEAFAAESPGRWVVLVGAARRAAGHLRAMREVRRGRIWNSGNQEL